MNGRGFASLIWVYFPMPLFGAIFAALFFRINVYFDNRALKEVVPPAPVVGNVAI